MARRKLCDVELWDGRNVLCSGFRDGLPVWGWRAAPSGLATLSQIWEQGRRRARGQDPVGLLVYRKRGCGEQVGELYRLDQTIPSRPMTPGWRASIDAMQRAHRTCRRCQHEFSYWMPTSTWTCWGCMEITGDYGQPVRAS